MKRGLLTVLATLTIIVATTTPAMAGFNGTGDEVKGEADKNVPADTSGSGSPVFQVPVPYLVYRYTPLCSANGTPQGDDPNAPVVGADALCGQAVNTCPKDTDIRYRVSTMKMTADGKSAADWEIQTQSVCRGADDPDEGGPVQITEEMIHDEAVKKAPVSVVHVEPKINSYVNVPNNFYADTDARTVTMYLFDQGIKIEFTPSNYSWSFGDGGSAAGAGIKAAQVSQNGAVEYDYRRIGNYSVTLSRNFTVTYTLPDGKTGSLDGPVSNTSAPYRLGIGEVQSVVTDVN